MREESIPLEYWLPAREYAASAQGGDYAVSYLYRRGDTLSLRVEKKVSGLPKEEDRHFEEAPPLPEGEDSSGATVLPYRENGPAAPERALPDLIIAFRDENGAELDLPQEERNVFAVHDETNGTAVFAQELEIEAFTWERFTLVLDGEVEFWVELSQVDPERYDLSHSTAASCAGYQLSFLPLNETGSRFALIPAPEGEQAGAAPAGSYWNAIQVEAVGESGTLYQVEGVNNRPGGQEFYIPGLPEERIVSVSAAGILESTRYEKSPAAIRLPAMKPGEEKKLEPDGGGGAVGAPGLGGGGGPPPEPAGPPVAGRPGKNLGQPSHPPKRGFPPLPQRDERPGGEKNLPANHLPLPGPEGGVDLPGSRIDRANRSSCKKRSPSGRSGCGGSGGIPRPRRAKKSRRRAAAALPGTRRPCSYIPRVLGFSPVSRPRARWVSPNSLRDFFNHTQNICSVLRLQLYHIWRERARGALLLVHIMGQGDAPPLTALKKYGILKLEHLFFPPGVPVP